MLIWDTPGQTCWGQYTDFIWGMASHIKPTCNKCRYFIFFFHVEYCYVFGRILYMCSPYSKVCGLYSASQYQHDYIISLAHSKNYITFLPSLNLNPSVNLCKDRVVSFSSGLKNKIWLINRKKDIEWILSQKAVHVKILSKVENIGHFFLHPCYVFLKLMQMTKAELSVVTKSL